MTGKIESHNPENKKMVARMISLIHDANNNIPAYLNNLVIDRLLWAMTEQDNNGKRNKHSGQPYWSADALKKNLNNRNSQLKPFCGLIHEHSVPKKVIKKLIMRSGNNESDIFKILDTFGHAVIITEEGQRLKKRGLETGMPNRLESNSNIDNIFSRYIEVGINVCDVRGKELRDLTSEDIDELEMRSLTNTQLSK